MKRFLECCSTSLQEARDAERLGARRIELCENLPVGGVTPGAELLREVVEGVGIPVNVLVRPRGGDFVFSEGEIREMEESIEICRELGANGVVIGALLEDGRTDMPAMQRLMAAARGKNGQRALQTTFHRAIDVCADPFQTLRDAIELGCDRVLTSGHEPNAFDGRFRLARMVDDAAGRIIVMPGCGVRPSNLEAIAEETGAEEFHASFTFFR